MSKKVFKKASPNNELMVYLGRRDFYDHGTHVDPIDGMITVDTKRYLQGRKVFASVKAMFSYGIDDMDLLGVSISKELYTHTVQVYPPEQRSNLTALQQKLAQKLAGKEVFPFVFQLPTGLASSVTLQQPSGKRKCGVDYELCLYVAKEAKDKVKKRNSVRLNIRKLTYAQPNPSVSQPSGEVSKKPMLSSKPIDLAVSLDKELYYHGEPIQISVKIKNHSSKNVKSMQVRVRQFVVLQAGQASHETLNTKCGIATLDSSTGCPIRPDCEGQFTFTLTPAQSDNKHQVHLALDGQIKDEDTSLASSTQLTHTESDKNIGLIVTYEVKVKLIVFGGDIVCKVPFSLSNREPDELGPESLPHAGAMPDSLEKQPSFGGEEFEMVFEDFMKGRAEKFFSQPDPSDDEQ